MFSEDTPIKLIKSLRPDIITKGGDYKKKDVVGFQAIKDWNGKVHILDYIKGSSTSDIINKSKKI